MRSARKFIRREKRKKNFCESFHMLSWSTSICTSREGREVEVEVCGKMCVLCVVGGDYRLSSKTTFRFPEKLNFFFFFLFSFPSTFVECQWKHGKIKEIIIKHFYCRPIEREKNARCKETGWPIVGQRRFILSLNQSALSNFQLADIWGHQIVNDFWPCISICVLLEIII